MIRLHNVLPHYSYPLVLVRGEVPPQQPQQNFFLNNVKIYSIPIRQLTLPNETLPELTSSWPLGLDGQFKILLHLTLVGENWFRLWIGSDVDTRVDIKLCYRPEISVNHQDSLIRLIYVLCPEELREDSAIRSYFDDGRFEAPEVEDNSIESAEKRISIAAMMAQCFFADSTRNQPDSSCQTFRLELDSRRCWPVVHRLKLENCTNHTLWSMKSDEIWQLVATQLMNRDDLFGIGDWRQKQNLRFLAFCSFSRFRLNPLEPSWLPANQVQGYVSLGGGGLALLSTHCLYTWPESVHDIGARLVDYRKVDEKRFMNDSNSRDCLSGCYATTLGATFHELAHTFHLGHSHSGLMSRDFNQIDQFFLPQLQSPFHQIQWFTNSEIAILRHSRWFRTTTISKIESTKTLDYFTQIDRTIRSEFGLIVVQYRQPGTNLVLASKLWSEPVRLLEIPESIQIEEEEEEFTTQFILFVMDTEGNVMCQDLTGRI